MTIDDRLHDAAREAKVAVAGLGAAQASRARRSARWRGPATAAAAAVVVVAVIAGFALLRDGATTTTVAPAGPEPTTPPAEETADAVPVIPEGAVRVPIGGASATSADAARRAAEDAEGLPATVIGAVGETVLLTVDRGGGELCLAVVDLPRVRSSCGQGGPQLGYSIRQLPDGGHQAVVSGRLPAGATIVLVTAGDTQYAQDERDGWVFLPFDAQASPVRIEALAEDGRRVAAMDADAELVERVMAVLRLGLIERAAEVRIDPDPVEQAVLDAQLKALDTPIVAEGEAATFEELLALGEQRLEDIRREVESRPSPEPAEYPRVIPTQPEVTAALGDTLAIAAPSQPGRVWLTSALRVEGSTEFPALLFEVDAATGRMIANYVIGLPMHHLAAGSARVWFGRTGDGALPAGAVGYLDLTSGELDVVETDRAVADVVLADESGAAAWVVGGEPGAPLVARVGPEAALAPLSLDFDPGMLLTGLAWDGGLLVGDDAGTLWRADASNETAVRFAALDGAPVALGAATLPGGEPAVWALVWSDPEIRAVLLDGDGEAVAEHALSRDTRALVTEPGTGAFTLTMSGEVRFLDADQAPVLIATVDPGSPDTGFDGMARSGTALWLRGGMTGLVWLELGQ